MIGWRKGNVGWRTTQTNKALDWTGEWIDVGLCLGFLAGDESAERGRRRRGKREKEKEKENENERKSADV